ncbi:hypothetical protein PR048_004602 [Dryococelus australis]|uniref:Uncharacterized protein n=1 Tax=Dryococelus australis TaxID=614101 RepID=A0ABQ9I5W1_9NEOP|nr:hypothetical protein PR048_004602 [Dryococelus australis]
MQDGGCHGRLIEHEERTQNGGGENTTNQTSVSNKIVESKMVESKTAESNVVVAGIAARTLTIHQGEPGVFPGGVTAEFSHTENLDAAVGQWVFTGYSSFLYDYTLALRHLHLTSPSKALWALMPVDDATARAFDDVTLGGSQLALLTRRSVGMCDGFSILISVIHGFPKSLQGNAGMGPLTKAMADSFPILPQSLFPVQLAPSLMTTLSTRHAGDFAQEIPAIKNASVDLQIRTQKPLTSGNFITKSYQWSSATSAVAERQLRMTSAEECDSHSAWCVVHAWRSASICTGGPKQLPGARTVTCHSSAGRSPRKPADQRHDSHMQKSGVTRPGIEPGSPWREASSLTAQPLGGETGDSRENPLTSGIVQQVFCLVSHVICLSPSGLRGFYSPYYLRWTMGVLYQSSSFPVTIHVPEFVHTFPKHAYSQVAPFHTRFISCANVVCALTRPNSRGGSPAFRPKVTAFPSRVATAPQVVTSASFLGRGGREGPRLTAGLVDGDGLATLEAVSYLEEAHAGRVECAGAEVAQHQSLRQLLVRHDALHVGRTHHREGAVRWREQRVHLAACNPPTHTLSYIHLPRVGNSGLSPAYLFTNIPVMPPSLYWDDATRIPPGHYRIFACGNCAGQCRCSAGFLGGLTVSPAPSFRRGSMLTSITLIGSQDLDVKSHPNLFPHFTHSHPRGDPPTNGIVRHDSHMRKSGMTQPGIEPGSPWWEASRLTAQSPWPPSR